MTTADGIRPTLQSALGTSGLVLEDVVVTPAGRRRVVKVLLDRDLGDTDTVSEPTAPLSLDEVADATRLVSEALADLPPKEVVLGQLLGLLQAPATQLLRTLNEPGAQLARLVDALAKRADGGAA